MYYNNWHEVAAAGEAATILEYYGLLKFLFDN